MSQTATKKAFQKYPTYKDSGEYWMGDIPEHWDIKKLKHVFHEKKKVSNPNLNCGSISFGKVVYKNDEKVPESTKASYQEVLAGEYLVNPLNLNYDLISLRIGLSDINVVVSSGYIVLKNTIELDKSYFNYLLHRYDVAYMKLLGSGVRQTISFNHIANSLLAYPPIVEQTAIANFLDDKTAKIDRAIAQKEQLIALLKERKQIIIQNAVTGKWSMVNGEWLMTPKEKMKDSGVEWIGEIPEHWEVKKVKHCAFKISKGTTPSTEGRSILDEGFVRFIKAENIQEGIITDSPQHFIDEKTNEIIGRSKLEVNDILFVIAGATLGKVAIVTDKELPANTNQAVSFIRPLKEENPNYLMTWLTSSFIREVIWLEAVQSAQPNLSMEDLGNLPFIVPPRSEQSIILEYIETQSAKIDQAISLQQTQIEKLKEYKATLIDSAVTGKIMVSC